MRISDWSSDVCSSDLLGAAPAAMPVPELPQGLQKGVVDGAFIPWEIIPPLKIHEQTEYQIEGYDRARFGTPTFQVSRSEERRVAKGCGSTCRSRRSPYHYKKKQQQSWLKKNVT